MTIKTVLTAAALMVSPALALACPAHESAAISCADGTVYDSATKSCKVISG